MVKMIYKIHDMDFDQLMQVYEEGNRENGMENYPRFSSSEQILAAQQDFYGFLQEFFKNTQAFYAVLEEDGVYKVALRMEPYMDGLLLEALETKPSDRRRGYAKKLIVKVLAYLENTQYRKVYSHIHKKNAASIAVHHACGFKQTLPYARYIDGSVLHSSYTFLKTM